MNLTSIKDVEINRKKILLRIDTDVDIIDEVIHDDYRLEACVSTLTYLLEKDASVMLIGHLGRPEKKFQISNLSSASLFRVNFQNELRTGKFQIRESGLSLRAIGEWFAQKFNGNLQEKQFGNFPGWKITDNLYLIENIRIFEGEEDPDSSSGKELAQKLSSMGDIYINDAFAASHRKHVSTFSLAELLPGYAGFHLFEEVQTLGKTMENPNRPLVVMIGGAKLETKMPLAKRMHELADFVLVGGKIAQEKELILEQHNEAKSKLGVLSVLLIADLTENGLDITEHSSENFAEVIDAAGTIIWNGPVGKVEEKAYTQGTDIIAQAIANSHAYKIVGGGDTLAYLKTINMMDKFDFISTGGGAMLSFLSGEELPGIKVLETK